MYAFASVLCIESSNESIISRVFSLNFKIAKHQCAGKCKGTIRELISDNFHGQLFAIL